VLGHTNSYLSISRDRGRHWSKPRKLNRRPRTTTFPWVVAGSRGRVAVAYYGTRTLGKSPEAVVQPTEKRAPAWGVYVDYSLNALGSHPRYAEVRTFRHFIHQGNICTSGTGCATGTRDLLDFFQLDLDPCGHIVVTYTDNSRDVVTKAGQRTTNNPELVSFVGQSGGPTFYRTPLKSGC
jgi:hypothetical protein